jgi:tetratricopeptide (TPR) repeat protein
VEDRLRRPLKHLLSLLLAAAACHAHAALDAAACKPGPGNLKPGAVQEAAARLAAARSEPGERRFALADALADLALLSARQSGSPDLAADGNPAPAELLREALAIWTGAPPSMDIARTLQARGAGFFNSRQCRLGRELLEPALRLSSAVAGPGDPASVAIAQDLLRIALAQNDGSGIRRLAPAMKTGLEARKQPLEPQDQQTVLALVDFFYAQPDDHPEDIQLAEYLAQRGLALTSGTAASARRLLSYRLASIYYAQRRYADGEALRAQLAAGRPAPAGSGDAFMRQREELIALVRKGQLQAALDMARTVVEQRRQAFDASGEALAQAEAAQARIQAQQDPAPARPAQTQAGLAVAQARTWRNTETFWLAQARSYLGEIQQAMGDLEAAAGAYEEALAGFGDGRTSNWRDRTRTRSDLAIIYRTRGDDARALALQQQVLDELLPLVGEDHPDVKEARAELALLHGRQHG